MPYKTRKFAANKKWAISPLISPPAGAVTATQADKLVCILSIGQNAAEFNGKDKGTGIREEGSASAPRVKPCDGNLQNG
jgi:hypothetical protein